MGHQLGDQNHRTPGWLYELLETEIVKKKFQLDAAASKENTHCKKYYTEKTNGLVQPWWPGPVFCNPGFSIFGMWIKKAVEEAARRHIIACLIGPKGCSQSWFHKYAKQGTIYPPDQRISFYDSKTGLPTRGAREDVMVYIVGPGFWNRGRDFKVKTLKVKGLVVTRDLSDYLQTVKV